jgi:hypothetical protein
MEPTGIYFAAVVHDKTNAAHTPYVATPLGPYHPDEFGAHERAKAWLMATYKTEDIRRVEPGNRGSADFDTARGLVIQAVTTEHTREMRLRDRGDQIKIFCNTDPATASLDRILEALGVNPDDV